MSSTSPDSLSLAPHLTYPLWTYCLLILLLSVLGNTTVLYSSLRYNAINLDKVSVLLVRNLAVADLTYTAMIVLPIWVTYSAGGWVLGHGYCFVMSQFTFIPGTVNTFTVLAITLFRLQVLRAPLNPPRFTLAKTSVVCIWALSLTGTLVSLSYGSGSVFSPTAARCNSTIYRDPRGGKVFLVLATGCLILLPLLCITVGNVLIVCIAVKRSGSPRSGVKGIATVAALSGLFILSWTPLVVFTFFRIRKLAVSPVLDLLAFHCIFLNTAGNPVLYTLTNRRFGEYVRGSAAKLVPCCTSATNRVGATNNVAMASRNVLRTKSSGLGASSDAGPAGESATNG